MGPLEEMRCYGARMAQRNHGKENLGQCQICCHSAEIWQDLKERFGKESAPRAYELRRALIETRQEGTSVSTYYTKLRSLRDEIHLVTSVPKCICGKCTCVVGKQVTEMKDKERLYDFFDGA